MADAASVAGTLSAHPPAAEKPLPAVRVERPPEGRYNYVVVGINPVESFPETAGMMRCKLAYTVYLRIGTRPDWTLLYCPQNPGQGSPAKLDPPYAYLMLRPDLEFGAEDRLFVHGVLNQSGRLEQLAFPGSTPAQDRDLLSRSLAQWQFRPALREAQPTAVEVLLIIPRPEP